MNLQQLRSEGYTVQISHYRRFYPLQYNAADGIRLFKKYRAYQECQQTSDDLSPTGGLTTVKVTTPDNQVLEGMAVCSIKDNFNRRKGYQIALGRALSGSKLADDMVINIDELSAEVKF